MKRKMLPLPFSILHLSFAIAALYAVPAMTNDKRKMENGKWKMENGKWKYLKIFASRLSYSTIFPPLPLPTRGPRLSRAGAWSRFATRRPVS